MNTSVNRSGAAFDCIGRAGVRDLSPPTAEDAYASAGVYVVRCELATPFV
jgi:hypothetical protein